MRRIIFPGFLSAVGLLVLAAGTNAQIATGGTFGLDIAVTANGGGRTTGGSYTNEATVGQPAAGTYMTGGSYAARSGFWGNLLLPTAASASVGGRVLSANGSGIPRVRLTITDSTGVSRTVMTSSLGYYRFDELAVGETYVLSIVHKSYIFANQTQVISVFDTINDLDFTAFP